MLELEPGPHVREWLCDPLHRAAAQARVTFEARGKRMPGYYARDESRRRTAVAAIEILSRGTQRTQSTAPHSHLLR